jgi:hypothetical protein
LFHAIDVQNLSTLNNFENLNSITFNWNYDQVTGENILHNSLRTLTFGQSYNQTISVSVLPNSLQTLTWVTTITKQLVLMYYLIHSIHLLLVVCIIEQ